MKIPLSWLMVLFVLTGCRNAQPAGRSDISSFISEADINSENDLAGFVAGYISFHINQKTGLKVERMNTYDANAIELIALKDDGDEMMVMKVREFSLNSRDLLSQPVEVKLVIELTILDSQKYEVYQRIVTGQYQASLDFLMKRSDSKKLAEAVINDALSQYAEDPELKGMIAKLRYGSLSKLALIF